MYIDLGVMLSVIFFVSPVLLIFLIVMVFKLKKKIDRIEENTDVLRNRF